MAAFPRPLLLVLLALGIGHLSAGWLLPGCNGDQGNGYIRTTSTVLGDVPVVDSAPLHGGRSHDLTPLAAEICQEETEYRKRTHRSTPLDGFEHTMSDRAVHCVPASCTRSTHQATGAARGLEGTALHLLLRVIRV